MLFFMVNVFYVSFVYSIVPGPQYPPTKGEVWPKPQQQESENTYYTYDSHKFATKITNQNCDTLIKAIERLGFIIKDHELTASENAKRNLRKRRNVNKDDNYKGMLQELHVELTSTCEEYPYFGMDESYNITVAAISKIKSSSLWGILRALETWAQLFYLTDDYNELRINTTDIFDFPRYAHRGLLIDTSRHYITQATILKMLDAMAMNKMNVLHWHVVDDQSFPYQSEKFPELSRLGAYYETMVYTKDDIKSVVDYARDRAIRVLPEFDVPGHTRSWGVAFPNILTTCYGNGQDLGPMNPIQNATYKLLQDLITEVQDWFPDKYFHVGGDEVDLECWLSNPDIKKYMKEQNMESARELHALFMKSVIPLLGQRSIPIVWQEVFDEKIPLSKDTLVQVWKSGGPKILDILLAGYKVIYSSAWYLSNLKSGGDWNDFYMIDPRSMVQSSDVNLEKIVGGEACMWGEYVNDMNIISRVWPRASAVAEVLWSAEPQSAVSYRSIPKEVYCRLEEHTCRMNRRGIRAQPPNGPGFCVGAA